MSYLLNIVYLCLLVLFSPYLAYCAIRKGKYREGFAAKFLGRSPQCSGNRYRVWVHAVSVGEVNLAATLLSQIRSEQPDWEVVISTTTKTGFDLAQKKFPGHVVFYCPLDFSWAVNTCLNRIRPNLLVLIELELWPNLVYAAKRFGAKLAIVNGRLSENSAKGYRRLRWMVGGVLRNFDLIATQTKEYSDRFLDLGAKTECVLTTGSMKFDNVQTDRNNATTCQLRRLAGIQPAEIVLLAGSTQVEEETLAIAAYVRLKPTNPQLRLIIVPRHPERFKAVAQRLADEQIPHICRSELSADRCAIDAPVVLVDVIGELSFWWGMADIGLVGGSFGQRGGQNMIEPAAFGAAVCFGPNTWNFRDVVQLLKTSKAAIEVRDEDEFSQFLDSCLGDDFYRQNLGHRAQELVAQQLGATRKTVQQLALVADTAGDKGISVRIDASEKPPQTKSNRTTAPINRSNR